LQTIQDKEVVEIENVIMFLNEIIKKQKLDDVIDTGEELTQTQNNIEKLLNELRETGDPQLNEKLLSELKHMEETLQQMMNKLMRMAQKEHLDEFLNADAMKNIEQESIMEDLKAMKDALNKGDLDAALEAAKRLFSSLQKMMEQMKSSSEGLTDSFYSDTLKKMDRALSEMSELENKQRTLTENTEQLKKDIQKRVFESANKTLKSFFEKQKKRIDAIKNDFAETKEYLAKNELLQEYLRTKRELKSLSGERDMPIRQFSDLFGDKKPSRSVKNGSDKYSEVSRKNAELNREINQNPLQGDFYYIDKELPQTEETLSHLEEMLEGKDLKESLSLAKDVLQSTERWSNRLQSSLEQGKVKKKDAISEKEQEVTEKIDDAAKQSQKIVQDLESMTKYLDEHRLASMTQEEQETLKKFAEQQKELQKQTGDLMEMLDNLSNQTPFMDEKSKRQLEMASQSMSGAKERLDKQDVPGAVVEERESMYRIAEAKKGMQQAKERIRQGMMGEGIPMPFRGRMEEGQFSTTSEKVEIPAEDAYKVPKKYRQDILDALKEGLPEKYKELNKDYYQRLVD